MIITVMSIIHMVNKKGHQILDYASQFDAKCYKPTNQTNGYDIASY